MQRLTTKQLMDKSVLFRIFFWGAIVTFSAAVILNIVYPFTSCYDSTYNSCTFAYYYDCSYYGYSKYCCYGSSYCSNAPSSAYCFSKITFTLYTYCYGVLAAAIILYVLTFLIAIVVFCMFCNLRDQARAGVYSDDLANPIYRNPPHPNYVNYSPQLAPNNNVPFVYTDAQSESSANTHKQQHVILNH